MVSTRRECSLSPLGPTCPQAPTNYNATVDLCLVYEISRSATARNNQDCSSLRPWRLKSILLLLLFQKIQVRVYANP
jgi:hypothetical protein